MLENIVNICSGLNGILYTHLKIPFYIPLTLTILYFSVSFENNKNKTEYCISGVGEKLNTPTLKVKFQLRGTGKWELHRHGSSCKVRNRRETWRNPLNTMGWQAPALETGKKLDFKYSHDLFISRLKACIVFSLDSHETVGNNTNCPWWHLKDYEEMIHWHWCLWKYVGQ